MDIHLFARKLRTVLVYIRQYGILAFLQFVQRKVFHTKITNFAKTDVLGFYEYVRYQPIGVTPAPGSVSTKSLNWVIPAVGRGSGGHLNIFRFIAHLEQLGFENTITIVGELRPVSAQQAKNEIQQWFIPLRAEIRLGLENPACSHITIATSWQTAYAVRNIQTTSHRCYFIQDFEPWFYARGSEYAFAEDTYRFGFIGITAGDWLAEKLENDYGMMTHAVGFSYDMDRYRPLPKPPATHRTVFFYARPPTLRRGFELGLIVLAEVIKRLVDIHVIFAGWDVSQYAIPFQHTNAGMVALDSLPEIYAQCDVALVISFSNLSLLPLELMACGVPVVSNRGPFTEWLLNDGNAKLCQATVDDLANGLCDLLEDHKQYARLREQGIRTAMQTSWLDEAKKMGDIFSSLA